MSKAKKNGIPFDAPEVVGTVVQNAIHGANGAGIIKSSEGKVVLNRSQADLVATCFLELVEAQKVYSQLPPLVKYEDSEFLTDRTSFRISDEFKAIVEKHAEVLSSTGIAEDKAKEIVYGLGTPFDGFLQMLIAERLNNKKIAHTLDEAFSKGDTIDGSEIPYRGAFCEQIHGRFDGMLKSLADKGITFGRHSNGN